MPSILRVPLKPNYRDAVAAAGYTGRTPELERLKNILLQRSSATILVAGHRGVGKTSLVREALKTAASDDKRVVVQLSLPHLSNDSDEDLRGQILRSLARALYFELRKQDDLQEELLDASKALYDKTYLKELRLEEALEIANELRTSSSREHSSRTSIEIGPKAARLAAVGLLGLLGVGGAGVTTALASIGVPDWTLATAAVFSLLALFASLVGLTAKKEWLATDATTVEDALTASDRGNTAAVLDLSSETMEFGLHSLLERLSRDGYSCVFVIDELDKLEKDADGAAATLEQHVVYTMLSCLKNFFTLGSAVYVFVAGEQFYRLIRESWDSGEYSAAHTLFTDVMFVHVLDFRDMENLIRHLVADDADESETFDRFVNYLCWESRNHAFDMLTLLGDLSVFENGSPVLDVRSSGVESGHWVEGNVPDNWETLAGLQKVVGATYDENRKPLLKNERFNQALWLSLRQAACDLEDMGVLELDSKATFELPEDWFWVEGLDAPARTDVTGAIERMLAKLERFGFVGFEADTVSQADGSEIEMTTVVTRSDPKYPPGSIADENVRTPFEQGFVDIASILGDMADHAAEAGLDVEDEFAGEVTDIRALSDRVEQTGPRRTIRKAEVEAAIAQADACASDMVAWAAKEAVQQWVVGRRLNSSESLNDPDPRTGQPWRAGLEPGFSPLLNELDRLKIPLLIIGGHQSENQILVLRNLENLSLKPALEAYKACLSGRKGASRRMQRLPVLALNYAGDTNFSWPTDVLQAAAAKNRKSFIRRLRTRSQAGDTSTARAKGWTSLGISTDLGNLRSVTARLDDVSYVDVESEAE